MGLFEELETAPEPEPAAQPRRVLKNNHESLPPLPPMTAEEAEPVLLCALVGGEPVEIAVSLGISATLFNISRLHWDFGRSLR